MGERTGTSDGRLWLVDADVWGPAVEAWTDGLGPDIEADAWVAVARNAFGTMQLWGPRTGAAVTVHPARGWIFPAADGAGPRGPIGDLDRLEALLAASGPDDLDVFDVDDRPLFDRVRERLGPVGPDTVYAFVPALGAGGEPRLESVEVREAVPHVVALAALTERRIFPDVTR